jgi:hypothetical protein
MKWNLKTVLIALACAAVLLGLIAFYVVFYSGGGTYVVSSPLGGPDAAIFASGTPALATTSASSTLSSSTLALASSSSSDAASSTSLSGSASSTPIGAPAITWTQGNETMSITGATISGGQVTLDVQVAMGDVSECVPMNLRLIADEQGDLSPPVTSQFTFPDTGTCNGTPGETYAAQQVVFAVSDPTGFPFLFTTGGTTNMFFEVAQNADGTLAVQLPPQAD